MNKFIFLLLLFTTISCSRYSADIDEALQLAGQNSNELEKVLKYYSQYSSDSLKLKAAEFLIINMPGHFSNIVQDTVSAYLKNVFYKLHSLAKETYFENYDLHSFAFVDSLEKIYAPDYFPINTATIDSIINVKNKGYNIGLTGKFESEVALVRGELLEKYFVKKTLKADIIPDITTITSDFLIDHIDIAFIVWKQSPLTRQLSFEEFKETILPYRYFNEPLNDEKSSTYTKLYSQIFQSSNPFDMSETNRRFNFYTYAMDCFEDDGKKLGNFGLYDILQFYKFDCDRHAEWACKALNLSGIPTSLILRFNWNWRSNHYCVAISDTNGVKHIFTPKWQSMYDSSYFKNDLKFYQITYNHQMDCPAKLKSPEEQIPKHLSSPFLKDITGEFTKVADIQLPVNHLLTKNKLGYLGVFMPGGWRPVAWGLIDKKKQTINFKDVASAMYMAGIFEAGEFQPVGHPFFLNTNGELEWIKPDAQKKATMLLTRKYPERNEMVQRIISMIGTKIQGANHSDFSDKTNLYTLKESDLRDFTIKPITITNKQRFRYIQLVPPSLSILNIAVFEIYAKSRPQDSTTKSSLPYIISYADTSAVVPNGLTRLKLLPMDDIANVTMISDGNMETYYSGPLIMVDLGGSQEIVQIRFAPRNSNNRIVIGDHYELLYFDEGWKSAGVQEAKYNFLEYKDISENTIYWLHNLDHGKEELAFNYRNNKQHFINF